MTACNHRSKGIRCLWAPSVFSVYAHTHRQTHYLIKNKKINLSKTKPWKIASPTMANLGPSVPGIAPLYVPQGSKEKVHTQRPLCGAWHVAAMWILPTCSLEGLNPQLSVRLWWFPCQASPELGSHHISIHRTWSEMQFLLRRMNGLEVFLSVSIHWLFFFPCLKFSTE